MGGDNLPSPGWNRVSWSAEYWGGGPGIPCPPPFRHHYIFEWWFLILDQKKSTQILRFYPLPLHTGRFQKSLLKRFQFWFSGTGRNIGCHQNLVNIFFFWYTFQRQCVYFPFPQMRLRNKWTLNTSSVSFFRQAQWNGWPISIGPLFAQ